MEYLNIGSTPCDERCFEASHPLEIAETRIYLRQLQREFPKARLKIKAFPHDFGSYHEVVAYWTNEVEQILAYDVEDEASATWDDVAEAEYAALVQAFEAELKQSAP